MTHTRALTTRKNRKHDQCPWNPGQVRALKMTHDELELWVKPVDQLTEAEVEQQLQLVRELIVLGQDEAADRLNGLSKFLMGDFLLPGDKLLFLNRITSAQYNAVWDQIDFEHGQKVNCQLNCVKAIIAFRLRLRRAAAEIPHKQDPGELWQKERDAALAEFFDSPESAVASVNVEEAEERREAMRDTVLTLQGAKAPAVRGYEEAAKATQTLQSIAQIAVNNAPALAGVNELPAPTPAVAGELAAGRAAKVTTTKEQPSHSEDFTSVVWYGQRYQFRKGQQAESVGALWKEWEKGGHSLSELTIKENIDSCTDHFRLQLVFRTAQGYHPAFGTMIVKAGRGCYCLAEPTS